MGCRMVHESHLPEGVTEGILCSHDNALLEGLITNLFVVTGEQLQHPACSPEFIVHDSEPVITAISSLC